jgi:hypothetical protein
MSTQKLANELVAAVEQLSYSDKKNLLNEIQLSAFDEEQNKVVDQRIANVAAAAKSQPHLLRQVAAGLRRIDLTLESVVAGGKDVVDQAEKYRNLSIEDRFGLKGELRQIGII